MSSEGFDELYNVIDKSLIPPGKYYSAHRNEEEVLELLEDHMDLCTRYFLHIVKELDIEPIFDNLIDLIFKDKQQVKKIILYAIYYHDIGKLNPNFQSEKVHGEKIEGDIEHSFFSERLLTSFLIKKFPEHKGMIYLVTNVILRHHSRLKNFSREDKIISREQIKLIKRLSELTGLDEHILNRSDKNFFFHRDINKGYWPKVFLFVKLLYSLLVLSDSYSTVHFQYSLKNMYPLNTLTKPIRAKMFESYCNIPYNKDIDSMKPRDTCNTINDLRRNILIECNKNIKDLLKRDNKIFMLSVPTGGGKTNISMKLALDILEYDEKIKRIFYVFPYINIIEQNYDAINKTLFNDDFFDDKVGIISDIYSRAYFDKFYENEEQDASFLKKLMVVSDDNFLNNGVNVITNVNFFNSIIKNASNNRYKIANLCNSVVIIDEVQTLNDKTLRVFYDFIKETSQALNIYYIVMSATLPDFNDFLDDVDVPQIVENPGWYFNHGLLKRNKIIFKMDVHDIEGIKGLLLDEINQNYRTGNVKILVTLNLVDTSRKTYEDLKGDENFKGFIFYLLNSTISSLRRKKIIEEIKKLSKDRVIIVSTQSIEAGMDIDCDFGIRDYAVLDSIEQISGRINRECDRKKSDISKLFVIKYKVGDVPDCKKIYRNERFKILNKFNSDEIKEILENKEFNRYYRVLSESLQKPARDLFDSTRSEITDLHYQNINNDLNVIDNNVEKLDIFVCDEIPLDVLSKYDRSKIVSLIDDFEIRSFEMDYPIISDNMIITKNIYKIWRNVMYSTDKFKDAYIRRKITSLLNQFIISINNVKDGGQDMLSYLMSEEFVELDEDFNFILSTKKFLNCCSFKDGVMLNKLKNMMKKQVSGVVI